MITNKKSLNSSNSRKIFVLLFLASVLSVMPLVTFEVQTSNASSAVTNSSATGNNNTTTNNQNISALASSSPSLPATAIQINADFNNDGFADLAIGVPDEDVGSIVDAGAVNVIYGSASGLSTTAVRSDQFWSQNTPNVENVAQANDNFGSALSTGDFNKDGFADLAIGVPNEDALPTGSIMGAGAVNVIYGSASGLSATVKPDQFWSQNTANVEESAEPGDSFGSALSTGDFNKDGFNDLAIGVHAEDVGNPMLTNAGIVQVIYGSASGLSATVQPNQIFQQGLGGLGDSAEQLDNFGQSLAAGDFNNDAIDDLAVGVPLEGITQGFDGIVQVIYGSSSGLSTSQVLADQLFQQGLGGLGDSAEQSDNFGSSLAAGDFNSDGRDDLAVGAPGENFIGGLTNDGIVQVIYGSSSGLSTSAVLPDQLFILADGASPGNNAAYGLTLSAGDFNHGGGSDLAVGAPNIQLGPSTNAGIVHVLYGSSIGLGNSNQVIANHILAQGIPLFVDDQVETGDVFASSLSSADFNGDGSADLAVGVPGEDVDSPSGTIVDAGAVNVIYGNLISGLLSEVDQFWTQKIHNEIQRDNAESGDGMGEALK